MDKQPSLCESHTAVLSKNTGTLNMTPDKHLEDRKQSSTPPCIASTESKNPNSNFINGQHNVQENDDADLDSAIQHEGQILQYPLPTEIIDSVGPSIVASSGSRWTRRDPYRKEVCLQRASKRVETLYMYPFSDALVLEDQRRSFEELVQIFRRNLEDHPKVKSVCNEVTYSLFKCGPSPDKAEFAIVVVCEEAILERVQRILTAPAMLEHCCIYTVRSQSFWSLAGIQVRLYRWLFPTGLDTTQFGKSSLPIYFYSGTPRVQLTGSLSQGVHAENMQSHAEDSQDEASDRFRHIPMLKTDESRPVPSDSVLERAVSESVAFLHKLYGAMIVNPETKGSAVLSCIIEIGQHWYGLTAAHAFHEAYARRSTTQVGYHPIINKDDTDERERNRAEDVLLQTIRASGVPCQIKFGSGIGAVESIVWFPQIADFVQSSDEDVVMPKNLDWALIPLDRHDLARANVRAATISSSYDYQIKEIMSAHPGYEIDIAVLSSVCSSRDGTLLAGKTYLSSPDSDMIELWSVEVDGDTGLQKGCSGSLVVDIFTGGALGYVVSSDVFGKVQLIPLHQVFEQIREITAGQPVSLVDSTQPIAFEKIRARPDQFKETLPSIPDAHSPHTQRQEGWEGLDAPRHDLPISAGRPRVAVADIFNSENLPMDNTPKTTGLSAQASPALIGISQARMKLTIRQQPRAAWECGFKEQDWGVIDPPPILQLCLDNYDPNSASDKSFLKYPFSAVSCHLISVEDNGSHPGRDVSMIKDPDDPSREIRILIGQCKVNPFITEDLHASPDIPEEARIGGYYIFPNLCCRQSGRYKLRFKLLLFDIISMVTDINTAVIVESDEFTVYSAEDWPGVQPSSELTRKLESLGAPVLIKKKAMKSE